MSSLTIENLSRVVESGDIERLYGSEVRREGPAQPQGGGGGSVGESATTFSKVFRDAVEEVNRHQVEADRSVKELIAGRSKNIHETMLAVERADASLKLMMQVRNKILDAYREIMRMQV